MAEFSEHGKRTVLAQMKHHWWWKTNYVFDQLEITRYYTGLVLFLEEDHYVAEDFLYVLEMMYKRSTQLCRKCNILSLGTYFEASDNYTYDGEVSRSRPDVVK
uniref:Alpha-1,6-mannosyl-glycoprotein 2-beta-N-acetylglucosaminyltransferase n=1 Tax=Glossina pallidipes TaxID=7398 RepID=A0A1A9Z2I4_GLOPL